MQRFARALLDVEQYRGTELGDASDRVSDALPQGSNTETEESFWPSEAAGLASCGVFAWLAVLITGYQVCHALTGTTCRHHKLLMLQLCNCSLLTWCADLLARKEL